MNDKSQYLFADLTGKIIGCAMTVHSSLGNGYQEVIYQRCLGIEFTDNHIQFNREFDMPIYYKNHNVGTRRVDFLVEDKIMVEIKAIKELEPSNIAQNLNYLEAYNLQIGLLLNFGAKSLQFKRLINAKYNPSLTNKLLLSTHK